MKHFLHRKFTGEIISVSDNENVFDTDILGCLCYDMNEEELGKMEAGYKMFIIDKKIDFQKSGRILTAEENEKNKQEFLKDVEVVSKAKDLDSVRDILLKLVSKNYNQ